MGEIKVIEHPRDIQDDTLRARAKRAHCALSKEFIAMVNDIEVGFLSYEICKSRSLGYIYEIFVLPCHRRKGVATYLLKAAEEYSFFMGRSIIRLKPYALDEETNTEKLFLWYSRNGYTRIKGMEEMEEMEKIICILKQPTGLCD